MKKPIVYAFIDSQNLNLGTTRDIYRNKKLVYKGWKLDYKKFRIFLNHKFKVSKAFLFIGKIDGNEKMYKQLESFGYTLIFKPVVITKTVTKGNVDTEIVLHAAKIEYLNYDKAVIISGDGDFYCLYEELEKENKLYKIIIPNKKSESSLLKKFNKYKVFIEYEKKKLLLVKKS